MWLGDVMAACPNCGAEVKEADKYCTNCGASLTARAGEVARREKYARERDECFGPRERERDYTGLFSFGFLIITVGIVFTLNPGIFTDFGSWIEQVAAQETFVRPPDGLITTFKVFFGLIGVFNFAVAGMRLAVSRAPRRALSDALSGVALVLFAYLIHLYENYSITWQMVFAMEAVAVGLLIVLYSVVRYVLLAKA